MDKNNHQYRVRVEFSLPVPIAAFLSVNAVIGDGVWSLRLFDFVAGPNGSTLCDAEFLAPVHLDVGDRFPIRFGRNSLGHCTVVQ